MNKLGESIIRPFLWWLSSFIIFFILCYQLDAISVINPSKVPFESYNNTWLSFLSLDESVRNNYPLGSYRVKNLWASMNYSLMHSIFVIKFTAVANFLYPKSSIIYFIGMLQSILSSILIYLFIIGIKKRFRQR